MLRKGHTALIAMAAAGLAGMGGLAHSSHAAAAGTPPTCSYLYFDDASDAPDDSNGITVGPQQANLDIVEGDFGLTPDGTTLRAVLTLVNQDFAFSTSGPGIDYQMVFQFGTNPGNGQPLLWATDASLTNPTPNTSPNPSAVQQFTFGSFVPIQTSQTGLIATEYAPIANSGATGSMTPGPGGKVEVDVPLSSITIGGSTPPTIASTFTKTQGFSASGQGNQGVGNEFFSDVDPSTTTFGNDYTVGQATCISAAFQQEAAVPEASVVPLIAGAGGAGLLAGGLALRRRKERASSS